MVWKKNGFSYVMWFLYTLLALGGLYIGMRRLCAGIENPVLGSGIASSVALLTGGMLAFAAHRAGTAKGGLKIERSVSFWLEALFLAIIALLVIFLHREAVWSVTEEVSGNLYVQAALVEEGRQIPQTVRGIVFLYLQLLHLVFLLLGNKLAAAVILQFVLYYAGLLAWYMGVKSLSGVLPAAVMLIFACVSPDMAYEAASMSPTALYLLLYGVALWVVAIRVRRMGKALAWSLAAGFFVAWMIYLDVTGIALLLVMAGGILMRRPGQWEKRGERIFAFALSLVGTVVFFFLFGLLEAQIAGKDFANVLSGWRELYTPGEFAIPLSEIALLSEGWGSVALVLLSLGIFSFWCHKKKEWLSVWVPAALFLIAAAAFGMFSREIDGVLWLRLIVYILSGVGIAQYFGWEKRVAIVQEPSREVIPESLREGRQDDAQEESLDSTQGVYRNVARGESPDSTQGEYRNAARGESPDSTQGEYQNIAREEHKETSAEDVEQKPMKDRQESEKVSAQETGMEKTEQKENVGEPGKVVTVTVRGETKQVKLLDNPLPLPKQHEHKTMDYSLKEEVQDLDGYDYPVSDDDDFDQWNN